MNDNFEVIYSYSRKQAIEDGCLADVTEWAKETGFKAPVCLTSSLWNLIENIPEESGHDIRGRAHDVLFMAYLAVKKVKDSDSDITRFEVIISVPNKPQNLEKLLIHIGSGDEGEAVITIGFPEDF